ncbi:HlyD family efflux transporter periplasmic adaptor subunit [Aquimarina agarilytica]|uniref:HlyD family efflux transporter periplasmic adaptor subunit n=1 Tax=Aquimarina agarilytica TaxID=1087449 RepID=UPI000289A0EF|nr:HlyD family efflux transporter periplasmic adaptor subunit [Aquimarina agarilytica]
MTNENELEPHQYQDIYFEYDEPFLANNNNKNKKLFYYGLFMFILIIILGFTINIPKEVNLLFNLKGGIKESIGQYPDKVFILERHVEIGKNIEAGTPIVTITSEKIINFIEKLAVIESDEIKFNESELELYKKTSSYLKLKMKNAHTEKKKLQIHKNNIELRFKTEKSILEDQLEIVKKDFKRNQILFKKDVIAERDLDVKTNNLKKVQYEQLNSEQRYQTEMALINEQIANQKNLITELEGKINLDSLTRVDKHFLLKKRKTDIIKQLKFNYGSNIVSNKGLIISSSNNGIISYINTNETQISSGEFVWKLITNEQQYHIVCEANSFQIGELKKGLPVILKYDSFPFLYYGTMKGIINNISLSSKETGNYLVNIKIKDQKKLHNKVKKGMRGKATIIVEELPVFYYLLKNFLG